MYGEYTEAYDDEASEAFDDEAFDDEAFDDESSDDEARPQRLRFRPRRRLGNVGATTAGVRSVDRLVVNTPRGPMTLNLQEKLVREEGLKVVSTRLEKAINQHTTRLNSTQADIAALSKRVSGEVAGLDKGLKRLRRSQEESMMMTLMFSLIGQGGQAGAGGLNNNALLLLMLMPAMSGSSSGGSSGSSSSMASMLPLFLLLGS
jgi:hypothetical protein